MVYITEKDCHSIMDEMLKGKNFQIIDFVLQPFSEVMGFHGSHALLKITAKVGGKEKEYSFFVKLATKNQVVFDKYLGPMCMFLKEHVIITKLIKELQAQLGKRVTSECYLSRLDKFMVLENLNNIDYEVIRVKGGPDFKHSKIAVQTFADFHAASVLLEENGTHIPEKYPEVLKESLFRKPDGETPDECLTMSCHYGVSKWAEKFSSDIPSNIREETFNKVCENILELVKPSKIHKNVLCHGDPWGNNIMYRYQDGVPVDGILVDFQAARFAPPAIDLMQFLYVALSKDTRDKHGEELKEVYYSRLAETLCSHGVDIERILPRGEFEETCQVYKDFGICVRLYYSYITRVPGQYLLPAVKSVDSFLGFMIRGDPQIPIAAAEDNDYKEELCDAIREAVQYYTGYSFKNIEAS